MKRFTTILVALAVAGMLVPQALAKDTGSRDILRLSNAVLEGDEWKVAVHVINDQELAALDIPIRFGQAGDPIELVRVDFSQRVQDWDFTHAAIDNQDKTVILGLISELVNIRVDADMKASAQNSTQIAELVFRVDGDYDASFTTFTTERPGHELTFIYNERVGDELRVASYVPEFEVDVDFKGTASLPTEFALSDNFPNPFNPTTSFRLSLPEESDYSIRIFNVAGQLVRSWEGREPAGTYTITWDGRNNQSAQVASGVYFYKAEANGRTETRKMLMLK
jgi:hypothetical protein